MNLPQTTPLAEQPQPLLASERLEISDSTLPWRGTNDREEEEEEGESSTSFTRPKEEGDTLKKLKSPLKMRVTGAGSRDAIEMIESRAYMLPYRPPTIYTMGWVGVREARASTCSGV